ncbi:hypothetical protein F6Y05_01760 (plasmid) [Bacillus megaterium]|nr:hypothetical protein [Priestia megaterium]
MKLLKHNEIPNFISFLIVGLILTVLFMLKGAALIIVAAVFCIFVACICSAI